MRALTRQRILSRSAKAGLTWNQGKYTTALQQIGPLEVSVKRIMIVGLFVFCLFFLSGDRALAQGATSGGYISYPLEDFHWQTIGNIRVMRVWQIEGVDKYPQVSILRVTTEDFHKFTNNPPELRKFVNENKVFSKPVITVGPCVALSSVDETGDAAGWIVTLLHTAHSKMMVSALPANPNLKPYFQPEK